MQCQLSFSELEYAAKRKQTRRDLFLAEIEAVTPWAELIAVIEPHYPKDERDRPLIGLECMLRMYTQNCFGLSGLGDEAMKEALYDSQAIRQFDGLDLLNDEAPAASTLLTYRHLLEKHKLTEAVFQAINAKLAERGLMLKQGTVVYATLIAAPSSTKNQTGSRNPDMHQTKKGNQWHFVRCAHPAARDRQPCRRSAAALRSGGMKAHVGVDARLELVRSLKCTTANEADVTYAHELLAVWVGSTVFADAGYQGADKREDVATKAPMPLGTSPCGRDAASNYPRAAAGQRSPI